MIELKHVTKRYGAKCAVDDISFTINKGEVLGFLGRNGAGKSTTMNMITGYISASEGQITLDGMDVLEQPREVKRRIGYLPEQRPLYMDMTVEEYLKFVCDIKEVRKKSQKAHLDDLYNLVKITDVRHRLIKNLSKGYKAARGLAQALVGNPDVVIMDEPTVGLDPKQIIEIRKLILRPWAEPHGRALLAHPARGCGCVRPGGHHQQGPDRCAGHAGEPDAGHRRGDPPDGARRRAGKAGAAPSARRAGRKVRRGPGQQGSGQHGLCGRERQQDGRAPGPWSTPSFRRAIRCSCSSPWTSRWRTSSCS